MAQTKEGALKLAASHYNMTVDEFVLKIATMSYCNKCKQWKDRKYFCIDRSRSNGLHKNCQECRWKNNGIRGRQFEKGSESAFKGRKHPESARILMRSNNKGSGNPNWKGGITKLIVQIRNMSEFKIWRMNVYHAGKFTCYKCAIKKIGNNIILDADHIYPLGKILFENKVKSVEDALLIPILWDINNGRCLCRECHKQTPTWGVNVNRN